MGRSRKIKLINGANLKPEPVKWLWDKWLVRGKLNVLAGPPGTGKTSLAMRIAATVSAGGKFPDGATTDRGTVLVWSGEDGYADTLLPRFLACGGDAAKLVMIANDDGEDYRAFDPGHDIPELLEAVKSITDIRLIIIDPIVSAVTGDTHKDAEVRRGLAPLVAFAAAAGAGILGICHFSKGTAGRDPLERVSGSVAFGAVPRMVLATTRAQSAQSPSLLVRVKSTCGPLGGAFEYSFGSRPYDGTNIAAQMIEWGNYVEGSPSELFADADPACSGPKSLAPMSAEVWLSDCLGAGPKQTLDIMAAGEKLGFHKSRLKRAKDKLGVTAYRMDDHWWWRLPLILSGDLQGDQEVQEDQPWEADPLDSLDSLVSLDPWDQSEFFPEPRA